MSVRSIATGLFGLLAALAIQGQEPPSTVPIAAGHLRATLVDNVANRDGQGSGLSPLTYTAYPATPIFRPELVGLNFEHIFNGAAADKDIAMFTPRRDPCHIRLHGPASASLEWPVDDSSWAIGAAMRYTLSEPGAVDIAVQLTPTEDRAPLGFLAAMWASYMNRTRERAIHFIGRDGDREGWVSFGLDTEDGFETGTIAYDGVPDLPYEEGAQLLNLREHPTKKFSKPFYYGLLDGDGNLSTGDDILAYIVMFDQAEPIRFALWNFIRDENGEPDPHSPAWDWQYVIPNPVSNHTYSYRTRIVICPFQSQSHIEAVYDTWRASLAKGDSHVLETP